MKVTFSARHFEASEKLQDFALKEMEHLKRYFEGKMTGDIILEENGNKKAVEIRLNMLGKLLKATGDGNDFYKLIPTVVDKIEKQIKSTKSKIISR